MPKFPSKKNVRKKPLESVNSGNNDDESSAKKKRKSNINNLTNNEDSIAVSKQLSKRIQSSGSSRIRTTRSSNKNNEPKICGNGKPMPSLAELEKMYDDSDDESPEEPQAAKKIPISPKSIKNIASRLMDKITKISDPTELLDVLPPPPIVPQKKPKKSGIPYIIGCKERPQVIRTPNISFCKGDDYGVELNAATSEDEDSCSKICRKRSKKANISKSIFNAKSDEIAERLKENDDGSDGSTDSNKTVAYTYYNSPELSGRPHSFSPIPSTSRDNETILKNDQSFNESLIGSKDSPNDVEIIDVPCETIVIDDESFKESTNKYNDNDAVEIIEPLDKGGFKPKPTDESDNDDLVQIIEVDEFEKTNRNNNTSPIDVDEYYSSIDIDQTFDDHDVEDIAIDDLIRENNAIIGKFAKESEFNVITHIQPSTEKTNFQNKTGEQTNAVSTKETTNDFAITPPTIESRNSPSTVYNSPSVVYNGTSVSHNSLSTSLNSPSAAHNGPSVSLNSPSTSLNSPSTSLNSPSTSLNSPSASHNSSSAARKSPNKKHNNILRRNYTSLERRENMMKSIVRNFFHSDYHNTPQHNASYANNTVDLTNDAGFSSRQTQENSIPIKSSLNFEHCFKNIIVNLHNLLQQQQPPPPPNPAPVQARLIPDSYTRKLKPTKKKGKPECLMPRSTPDEDTPKRGFGDCPICMESLGNNLVASTVCGHVFCLKCIQAAIKASGKKCPTCRKKLKGVGYHQLFL